MKYISLLLLLIIVFSGILVGGIFDYPQPQIKTLPSRNTYQIQPDTPSDGKKSLQLKKLDAIDITPTPTPTP